MSQHLTQPLTLKPLEQALRQSGLRDPSFGSRRSVPFKRLSLDARGAWLEISVTRRGCPWENGYAERLIRTLKEEEVYLNDYENIHEARDRIGYFIEQVYHQKRPHSALGNYLTPMEFEQQNLF